MAAVFNGFVMRRLLGVSPTERRPVPGFGIALVKEWRERGQPEGVRVLLAQHYRQLVAVADQRRAVLSKQLKKEREALYNAPRLPFIPSAVAASNLLNPAPKPAVYRDHGGSVGMVMVVVPSQPMVVEEVVQANDVEVEDDDDDDDDENFWEPPPPSSPPPPSTLAPSGSDVDAAHPSATRCVNNIIVTQAYPEYAKQELKGLLLPDVVQETNSAQQQKLFLEKLLARVRQ